MDEEVIHVAYKLKFLIDSKHQYARAIDASTRQLIQLVIGQQPWDKKKKAPTYTPTKEAFQADLLSFANTIFQQLSKPPHESIDIKKAFQEQEVKIDQIVEAHMTSLADVIAERYGYPSD
jgi:hypothetical protein